MTGRCLAIILPAAWRLRSASIDASGVVGVAFEMNPISRNALLILFDTISGRLTTGIWLLLYLAVVTVASSGGEAWAALSPYLVQGLTLTYQGYQCNNQQS